jgi:hypothetical protein
VRPTYRQEQAAALLGATFAAGAVLAHFSVPKSLEPRLGLEVDPWYRAEIGTVNAGFLYGALRHYRGHRDPTSCAPPGSARC